MQRFTRPIGTAVAVVILVLTLIGLNTWILHWHPFGHEEKSTLAPRGPAQIVRIESIDLDCRARITAHIPIQGKKDYRVTVFGMTQTYRTDTMTMTAIGDVDTCVDGGKATITRVGRGWHVTIPASSVQFVRPRVDGAATMGTVHMDKGWFGKLTDIPWFVHENNGLTPAGYAYAQGVIGGSSCMRAAWQPTQTAITNAYRLQASAKKLDPRAVSVQITGTPDFAQNDRANQRTKFSGFEFKVDAGQVECQVQKGALIQPVWHVSKGR